MWCCMYPSFFRFKRLVEHQEQQEQQEQPDQSRHENNINSISDTASIKNNMDEFISLFKTQEKACYELRSENTVLKMKLEVANEMIRIHSRKIKSLKMKKTNLKIENNIYKNVLCSSSLSFNNHQHSNFSNNNNNNNNNVVKEEPPISSHLYPPPPPPPLPLPPPTKFKVNGNFQMNSVLDELKGKIKKID